MTHSRFEMYDQQQYMGTLKTSESNYALDATETITGGYPAPMYSVRSMIVYEYNRALTSASATDADFAALAADGQATAVDLLNYIFVKYNITPTVPDEDNIMHRDTCDTFGEAFQYLFSALLSGITIE